MSSAWWQPFLKIKWRPLLLLLSAVLLLSIVNPYQLVGEQVVVLASLVFAVGSWATGALERTLTSILLLVLFMLFGNTNPLSIVGFIWSDVLLLIVFSSLLSVALGRNTWLQSILNRFIRFATKNRLLFYTLPYLLGIALAFLIPQAFARVVLLAGLYAALMKKEEALKSSAQAVFFHIYMAVVVTYMMFIGGDIVLNYSAVTFMQEAIGSSIEGLVWFQMMAPPTLVLSILMIILLPMLFRKELPAEPLILFSLEKKTETANRTLKQKDALGLSLMLVIVLIWATERLHGMSGWIPSAVGVLILFFLGRLRKGDLAAVNPKFLIFLMAAFNIGQVLRNSGVMAAILRVLERWIPSGDSAFFFPALVLITMVMHMFIGSAVATLSVVMPLLLPLAEASGASPNETALIFYVTLNLHFLFPFHQATMMIGVGKGQLSEKHVFKFGLLMSAAIFLIIFGLYRPWWNLISP